MSQNAEEIVKTLITRTNDRFGVIQTPRSPGDYVAFLLDRVDFYEDLLTQAERQLRAVGVVPHYVLVPNLSLAFCNEH